MLKSGSPHTKFPESWSPGSTYPFCYPGLDRVGEFQTDFNVNRRNRRKLLWLHNGNASWSDRLSVLKNELSGFSGTTGLTEFNKCSPPLYRISVRFYHNIISQSKQIQIPPPFLSSVYPPLSALSRWFSVSFHGHSLFLVTSRPKDQLWRVTLFFGLRVSWFCHWNV